MGISAVFQPPNFINVFKSVCSPISEAWLKKYQLKEALSPSAVETPADFIPLRVVPAEPTTPPSACVIEYPSGIVVRLHGPLDAALVAQLIHAAG